ncbi:hypothetical protein NEDG_00511 [Nematocida displodere]|uniref:Uncharacterized protein n=1 Tax=Nematocida displodere TaxID=1805483 RepID=A0A177EK14_9MICR|nr:hypothetical protein NEDG_00511 [Nematocida displodere]
MSVGVVLLKFPFRIDGREHSYPLESNLIRQENIVTFALPFRALVSVNAENTYTVHYTRLAKNTCGTSVTIEFKSINDAIAFIQQPEAHICYFSEQELFSVDSELERVSSKLEETRAYWKKRKRTTREDVEGYRLA